MASPRSPRHDAAGMLTDAVEDAVELLARAGKKAPTPGAAVAPEPSLLKQCLQLCAGMDRRHQQPIRTVHHFACTGGTLISKCIAALPNVQLLSEVDPLSRITHGPTGRKFLPTDMIGLVHRSTRGGDDALIVEMFRAALRVLYKHTVDKGLRLVLRDHAHSHFCTGDHVPERPSLRALLPTDLPSLSVVTVRHPLDSYASLVANSWVHFSPSTLDEYAKRYLVFLGLHGDTPRLRYEDFVDNPVDGLSRICDALQLSMRTDFTDLFGLFEISGDSGRRSDVIRAVPRRAAATALMGDARDSAAFHVLCDTLGYSI
jgi:hypothetical protein